MAAEAEQLEVVELVAPAAAERDAVVHLKAAVRAAADAGSVALVEQIDRTYGHMLPESEDYLRGLLDAFDASAQDDQAAGFERS